MSFPLWIWDTEREEWQADTLRLNTALLLHHLQCYHCTNVDLSIKGCDIARQGQNQAQSRLLCPISRECVCIYVCTGMCPVCPRAGWRTAEERTYVCSGFYPLTGDLRAGEHSDVLLTLMCVCVCVCVREAIVSAD